MPNYETHCFVQDSKYCVGTYVVRADKESLHMARLWDDEHTKCMSALVSVQRSLQRSKCLVELCLDDMVTFVWILGHT